MFSMAQIIIMLIILFIFGRLPLILIFHAFMSGREDTINHQRNSKYVYKGSTENGTPIYLEVPRHKE